MGIASRADFTRLLEETRCLARLLVAETPGHRPYASVASQLAAIRQWLSQGGPTAEERQSLTLGIIAVRELETNSEPAVQDLCNRVYEICGYLDRLS